MTRRSTPWIAVIAVAVSTAALTGSSSLRAEPAASPTPAASAAGSDAAAAAPASPASPGAPDQGSGAAAAAGDKDAAPSQPASNAAPEQQKEVTTPPEPASDKASDASAGQPEQEKKAEPAASPAAQPEKTEAPAAASADQGADPSGLPLPKDPVAKAAFLAFENNCARCHQAGPLLKKPRPQKNFGDVLELDKLADSSDLIVPGNPEASKLFKMISNQEMPYDCYQAFDCKREPTKEEVQAIYDWIKTVGDPKCTDRKLMDQQAIVSAIAADLDQQQEHRRKGMRYITLSNLYNACIADDDLELYRKAVVKLLNSLSTNPDVLKLRTIDPGKTIIAFNLDDLNWTEADWDRIIGVYPYAMRPDSTTYDTVKSVTNTPLAWVRGDWFAFTASRPPLYYDLLKLPKTFPEFAKAENVDVKKNIENFLAKRAGFQQSGVSKHNRLIERHPMATGYFWTSYDFKEDSPEKSLFEHPLGPDGPDAFKVDGGETIFSLPNGFQGYYLNKSSGERLDKGPIEIVLDDSQRDRSVTNGISCFGCHKVGINRNQDEIRDRVLHGHSFSNDVRKQVEALYPPHDEMKSLFDQDGKRYHNALVTAGLLDADSGSDDEDSNFDTSGPLESINALSHRYEADLREYMAAADFGIDADAFKEAMNDVGDAFVPLKRQLEQGHLPRGEFEPNFKQLIEKVSDNLPVEIAATEESAPADVAKVADTADITLISDRSSYNVNDLPVFTIKAKQDCHLTLIDVDGTGDGTVIFPNKFQQDNFVAAGKAVEFPAADSPFRFRLKDRGTETVIAICNASGKDVDGIKHDFESRGFTPLGNYREFLTRQIQVIGAEKVAEAQKPAPSQGTGLPALSGDNLKRTAVKLEVK